MNDLEGIGMIQMNIVINVLYVIVTVIVAIYIVPFLIALIASGLIQLAIGILFVYLLFKMACSSNTRHFDRD
jgi:hypothetical protein